MCHIEHMSETQREKKTVAESRRKWKKEGKKTPARYTHARHLYHLRGTMVNMSIMLAQWIYVLMWNNKFVMWIRMGRGSAERTRKPADWASQERADGERVEWQPWNRRRWQCRQNRAENIERGKNVQCKRTMPLARHTNGTRIHTHPHPATESWLLLLIYVVHTRITRSNGDEAGTRQVDCLFWCKSAYAIRLKLSLMEYNFQFKYA